MLHIALCDDDASFLSAIRGKITQWFQSGGPRGYTILIDEFSSGMELAEAIRQQCFDILFLDIEMPGLDGMELARQVRDALPWAIIIFLTSHSEFAPDGYRVQALRYIPKQKIATALDEALHAAVMAYEQLERGTLDVISYGNRNRIPYRDILYVRHLLRCSEISTISQGIVQDSRGIKELFDAIHNERFLFIERGAFVNVDHIQRVENGRLVLRTGEMLAISRRMLPQVKQTINRILGG